MKEALYISIPKKQKMLPTCRTLFLELKKPVNTIDGKAVLKRLNFHRIPRSKI